MKRGFLLMNTGSPDSTQVTDLRRYLKEFLMDPHVIDLPFPLRYALVHWTILPKRPAKSANAYKAIWTESGSPLIHYGKQIRHALRQRTEAPIEIGMAYGNPSFRAAIGKLLDAGIDEIGLLPLFPQYAMATVGACVAGVTRELKRRKSSVPVRVVPPFYNAPAFIEPLAQALRDVDEHILFSYHGLPLRHLKKTDPTGLHCLTAPECCSEPSIAHDTCYRHQCYATTRAVATAAGLSEERCSVSFQSRMGRAKWMKPYTEKVLRKLASQGHRRLVVLCPSFFCDGLETLEEIEIRGKEIFMAGGGESFRLIPCLNDSPAALHCLQTLMDSAGTWPVVS